MAVYHPAGTPCCHDDLEISNVRCGCGSMLAILREDGLELKCRRCKRLLLIAFPPGTTLIYEKNPIKT